MDYFNNILRSDLKYASRMSFIFQAARTTLKFIYLEINGLQRWRRVPMNFVQLTFDLRGRPQIQIKIFYHCTKVVFFFGKCECGQFTWVSNVNHAFHGHVMNDGCQYWTHFINFGNISCKFTTILKQPSYPSYLFELFLLSNLKVDIIKY